MSIDVLITSTQKSNALSLLYKHTVDTAVSTVGTSAHVRGTVDLSTVDNEGVGVEALELSVALRVLEESEDKLGTLGRPATLGNTPLLALGLASNATVETSEGDNLLLGLDVLEELLGTAKVHALDGTDGLTRVLNNGKLRQHIRTRLPSLALQVIALVSHLEANTEVRAASLAGCESRKSTFC